MCAMPQEPNRDFLERARRIEAAHRAAGARYVRLVEKDGMLLPEARARSWRGALLWLLLVAAVAFEALKVAAFLAFGASAYAGRVALIAEGSGADRIVSWLVQADPLVQAVAGTLRGSI
ncbi:MAG: hypothetical protein D6801_06910 [Alphaproteobacteria bacterium]|nr:MAG: hypothetical protein D6801_06910 [Alphaproteobacteria bacterium]